MAELAVEAGDATEEARVVTEGGDRRPVVELNRKFISTTPSLSSHSYLANVPITSPAPPPAPAAPPGAPPELLLEAWSTPGEPFSP